MFNGAKLVFLGGDIEENNLEDIPEADDGVIGPVIKQVLGVGESEDMEEHLALLEGAWVNTSSSDDDNSNVDIVVVGKNGRVEERDNMTID